MSSTYSYTVTNSLTVPAGGSSISTIESGKPANAILNLDIDLPISSPFNIGALLTEIKYPLWLYIKFYDDSGFKIIVDGTNPSSDFYKSMLFKFAPSLVPLAPSIKIVTTVAARLRVLCVGNPI